jgi:adenylate cyclase
MDVARDLATPENAMQVAVAAAVRDVVREEAKANELRVAYVRMFGFAAVLVLDVALALTELRPVAQVFQTLACTLVGVAVFVLVRRLAYQRWYGLVLPVLDAAMLAPLLLARQDRLGTEAGLIGTSALLCALLTLSGALRFRRESAAASTLLGAVLLVVLVGPHTQPYILAYGLLILAAVGFLSLVLAERVHTAIAGAASRNILERFLPHELVARSFEDPSGAIAAPRTVDATVLVSDLRGFTSLAEKLPPEQVFQFLSELHGSLAQVVARHGGTVDKFLGDGMLAVFTDDPRPLRAVGTHAERAVAAARDIRAVIVDLNARGALGAPVRLGLGMQSGPVITGCIGADDRLESTVIGDTVNTAARLEGLTKERGVDVLFTEKVLTRAPSLSDTAVSLGPSAIRGRDAPVELYTLPA